MNPEPQALASHADVRCTSLEAPTLPANTASSSLKARTNVGAFLNWTRVWAAHSSLGNHLGPYITPDTHKLKP